MFPKLTREEVKQIWADAGKRAARERALEPMWSALRSIKAERIRQVDKEGWHHDHDDKHSHGELANAAACYASTEMVHVETSPGRYADLWPWASEWDKRGKHTRRRELVKAAALIVAELERLDRTAAD